MAKKKTITLILFALFVSFVYGCTAKAWYEGGQNEAENNCRSQPPSEIDRCLEKLNTKTYEEYEKERASQS